MNDTHANTTQTEDGKLTAWERMEIARHTRRPQMLFYVSRLFEDFIELHGDRLSGDDPAMVCGIARFEGETVFVVGQHKGISTDEKVARNFGMAHPEGYRKALRIFRLAEKLGYPVVSFVDTPAAYPGIRAEERGQGMAIAANLLEMTRTDTPIFAAVLGEGGSGGALGIAVADYVAMLSMPFILSARRNDAPKYCGGMSRKNGRRRKRCVLRRRTCFPLVSLIQ